MATNFRNSAGTDFDDLFDPYVTGTVPPNTAFRTSDGVDLAGRYAPLSFGTKRADVNYRTSAGTDLSNLWAAKGTAQYSLPINGASYSAAESVPNGQSGSASGRFIINSDGTYAVTTTVAHGGTTPRASGSWLTSGSASDYNVRYTVTNTSGTAATVTNQAASAVAANTSPYVNLAVGPYGASSGSHDSVSSVLIKLIRVSTGAVVSATTISFSLSVDGSV